MCVYIVSFMAGVPSLTWANHHFSKVIHIFPVRYNGKFVLWDAHLWIESMDAICADIILLVLLLFYMLNFAISSMAHHFGVLLWFYFCIALILSLRKEHTIATNYITSKDSRQRACNQSVNCMFYFICTLFIVLNNVVWGTGKAYLYTPGKYHLCSHSLAWTMSCIALSMFPYKFS